MYLVTLNCTFLNGWFYVVWILPQSKRKVYLNWEIGEGNGTPLQYSCLENPMGRGAWWATVHGIAKSLTRLSDFTFTFYFHALEKEMATHSTVLAWRIPGMAEPGGLPSTGSHKVGHDWSDLALHSIDTFWNNKKKKVTFIVPTHKMIMFNGKLNGMITNRHTFWRDCGLLIDL